MIFLHDENEPVLLEIVIVIATTMFNVTESFSFPDFGYHFSDVDRCRICYSHSVVVCIDPKW